MFMPLRAVGGTALEAASCPSGQGQRNRMMTSLVNRVTSRERKERVMSKRTRVTGAVVLALIGLAAASAVRWRLRHESLA